MSERPVRLPVNVVSAARAIVADDHPIFRAGLAEIIRSVAPDLAIMEAGSFDEVLRLAHAGPAPQFFVIDLCFPGMVIETCVPRLRSEFPRASIVIVTMLDDPAVADRIIGHGVDGFISKSADTDAIASAIRALLNGDFVDVRAAVPLAKVDPLAMQYPRLTPRQREVMLMVGKGLSNKDIARQLEISPFTVRLHVSAILLELGLKSRSAIAAMTSRFQV
jgi:DNA-binding NarL/FixJ family response regulator